MVKGKRRLGGRNNDGISVSSIKEGLLELVNGGHIKKGKCKFKLKRYQYIQLYVFSKDVFDVLMKNMKFKTIGNIYDYPDILPQPDELYMSQNTKYSDLGRVAISNKYSTALYYSADNFAISCKFLVKMSKVEDFMNATTEILKSDTSANPFKDIDFTCKGNEYIELSESDEETRLVDISRKKMIDEKLVFDKESTINRVKGDILSFFTDDTKKLYKKLELPHKRGIILYGDPGNGKSTMIREIIRTAPDISKIIINPDVEQFTHVLSCLTRSLSGQRAIIIMEDIDSKITYENRSEFLNILEGVNIIDGIYFIGTTNYPERLDPAIVNRCGRFDRTYKIDNPTESARHMYFSDRQIPNIFEGYPVFKNNDKLKSTDRYDNIIDLFVKYSDNLPMASLKELITTTSYLLVSKEKHCIYDAIIDAYETMTGDRASHKAAHDSFLEDEDDELMGMGLSNTGIANIPRHINPVKRRNEKKALPKKTFSRKKDTSVKVKQDENGLYIIPKRKWIIDAENGLNESVGSK